MKTLERWLAMSTPIQLRKLIVFAEHGETKAADSKYVIGRYRACTIVGRSNEVACMGMGPTPSGAIEALDAALASEAGKLLAASDD